MGGWLIIWKPSEVQGRLAAGIGAAALLVSAFLPWITTPVGSENILHLNSGDPFVWVVVAVYILGAGTTIVQAAMSEPKRVAWLGLVVGIVSCLATWHQLSKINVIVKLTGLAGLGPGPWVALVGALAMIGGAVLLLVAGSAQ